MPHPKQLKFARQFGAIPVVYFFKRNDTERKACEMSLTKYGEIVYKDRSKHQSISIK